MCKDCGCGLPGENPVGISAHDHDHSHGHDHPHSHSTTHAHPHGDADHDHAQEAAAESHRTLEVRRAILDKNVHVPEGTLIGYDLDADRAHGWHVTDSGIVVIGGEHSRVPVAALFV